MLKNLYLLSFYYILFSLSDFGMHPMKPKYFSLKCSTNYIKYIVDWKSIFVKNLTGHVINVKFVINHSKINWWKISINVSIFVNCLPKTLELMWILEIVWKMTLKLEKQSNFKNTGSQVCNYLTNFLIVFRLPLSTFTFAYKRFEINFSKK